MQSDLQTVGFVSFHTDYQTIESTIKFIKIAHANQYDKGGIEYWKHCVAVKDSLTDASIFEQKAALLHDVLEMTTYTKQDLLDLNYSSFTLNMVELLTRDPNMTYMDYIKNIIDSYNTGAMKIKIADLMHNMNRNRNIDADEFRSLYKRYQKALNLLTSSLWRT